MPRLCFLAHKYPHAYREQCFHSRLVSFSLAHLYIKLYLRSHTFFSCNSLQKIPVWLGQLHPPSLSLKKPNVEGGKMLFSILPFLPLLIVSSAFFFTLSWWKTDNSHNKRIYWEVEVKKKTNHKTVIVLKINAIKLWSVKIFKSNQHKRALKGKTLFINLKRSGLFFWLGIR